MDGRDWAIVAAFPIDAVWGYDGMDGGFWGRLRDGLMDGRRAEWKKQEEGVVWRMKGSG